MLRLYYENSYSAQKESGRTSLNWFQNKFRRWFEEQNEPAQPPSGALAKRYGDDLNDPNALIHRANKRATGGDIEGAFADFNEAIQLNPTRATAFYNRGFLNNTLGHFEAAIEDFNRALDLLPDYDEAYYQRGNSRLQIKETPTAIQDFSRAIQLNPYSIKSYYKRAEAYADLGDTASVLADYAQAIVRIPKDANVYYQRGRFLAKIGETQKAIVDFTTALGHDSRHADAYCNRGCCYAELGDMEKANQDFNQALLHNPSHQAAYYQRMYSLGLLKEAGVSVQQLNSVPPVEPTVMLAEQPSVAIEAELVSSSLPHPEPENHSQTVKLEPNGLMGYFDRASNRVLNGDVDGAIADYTAIIQIDPHNSQAYYRRGQSYSALGQNEAALQDLDQAIHWARIHSLGLLKDFSGALSETIQTLKTELQKPKPSEAGPPSTGMSIEAAIAQYSEAIATNPTNADAYFKRAQSRALLGDLQGAIADYTETIRHNPEYPDAYYRRALSRSALGDTVGSTQDFNQAILRKRSQPQQGQLALPPANTSGTTTRSNPGSYCNHRGNPPNNRFCIHCGESIVPLSTRGNLQGQSANASLTPAQAARNNAEAFFLRGQSRCRHGSVKDGLTDLGTALTIFLEQQQMSRYQETLDIIQQFSKTL
jgi:tetratricopeptide (TPR) repeat protein